jgi:hypothetical protein
MAVLKEVVFVAMGNEIFRRRLVFEPDETLCYFDLSKEELSALRLGDKEKMVAMGLEENLAEYGRLLFSKRR